MKTTLNSTGYFLAVLLLFNLSSCMLYTDVQIKKPVDIAPEDVREVKDVLILNRTAIPKGSSGSNVFEAILTGETIYADKQGAIESVKGMQESIAKSLNYKSSQTVPVVFYGGQKNQIPTPLPWTLIDSLCLHYKTDALVSLEYFDSNSGISATLTNPTIPLPLGYPASNSGNINVKSVWRMYNPKTKVVIDDYTMNNVTNSGWRSPYFVRNQSNKFNSVASAGYWAGIDYGFRISEQWVLEGRRYWKGGNKAMRYASKSARFNLWDEALNIWEGEANSRKPKVRARALHNIAIYYERKGDLVTALSKARESFNIKRYSHTAFLISSIERQMNNQGRFLSVN
jgi:Family of unknown function (DUF6340)